MYFFNLFFSLFDHLAEFIIMLGERNSTIDKFQAALAENGAEFPVSDSALWQECLTWIETCQGCHN